MTKDEAIKYLKQLYPNGGHCWLDEQRIEAIGMAIKALQEEPVSEELGDAANNYGVNVRKGYPRVMDETDRYIYNAFKAGAKWQKEQMMKDAIDGYVIEDIEEGNGDFLLSAEYLPKSMGLKDQQKVKVIVIRED